MVTSWVRERRLNSIVEMQSSTSPETNTRLTPNLEIRTYYVRLISET